MLRSHARYCQQHQLLGLEKLGAVCVRYRRSGKTLSSRVLPAGDLRVLFVNDPGAQLMQRGLGAQLTSHSRAPGLSCLGLTGGGSALGWTFPAIACGPENKTSELRNVRSYWNSVVSKVEEGEGRRTGFSLTAPWRGGVMQ